MVVGSAVDDSIAQARKRVAQSVRQVDDLAGYFAELGPGYIREPTCLGCDGTLIRSALKEGEDALLDQLGQ